MFITSFNNFNFSYTGDVGIKIKTVNILVGYYGELTRFEFLERIDNILSGELNNLVFTTELYKYYDKLVELDELGIINTAVVDELDDDFVYIQDSIEGEFLNGLTGQHQITATLLF